MYEVYREVFTITERKDGAVFATESLGYKWVDMAEVDANRPNETNLIYASPSSKYTGPTIRHK